MKKILIVDDSNTARMFVRRNLEILGFQDAEIKEASNGKEALALLQNISIDLVTADLNMPLMDGESLLQWMKHNPKLKEIPFIFITSANNQAKADQLLSLGAYATLSKPFTPSKFSEILDSLDIK